jgi:AcrR family transcriptional regulator
MGYIIVNANYTKEIWANSLKELSKTQTLKKITVQSLAQHCRLNRGTFYYHFKDINDLICWIFEHDILNYFQEAIEKEWTHNTYHFLSVIKANCSFYNQALDIETYYNLRNMLYTMNYNAAVSIIEHALNGRYISDTARKFIAEFYAHAFTETNIKYIRDGARISPEKMLQYYYDLSEPGLLIAIDSFVAHEDEWGMKPF